MAIGFTAAADNAAGPPTTVPAALLRAIDLPPRYATVVLKHAFGDPWKSVIPSAVRIAAGAFGVLIAAQASPAAPPSTRTALWHIAIGLACGVVAVMSFSALCGAFRRITAIEAAFLPWPQRVALGFRPVDAVTLPTPEIAAWVDAALEHLGLPCATFATGTRPTDGAVGDALIRVAEEHPCVTALDQGRARLARRLAASLATLPTNTRWDTRATAYLLLIDSPDNHAVTDPVALRDADPALVKRDVALLHTILGQCFTPEWESMHALPHVLRTYQPLLAHRARDAAVTSS